MQKQFSRREFLKSASIMGIMSTLPFSLQQCASTREEYPRPNILWITAEDISPALGCYGDDYARTPALDALAEDGILYENAFATAPICAPARSTLITGIYATSLGTQHLRSDIPVPEDLKILPEYLREQGYFTTNNSKTDYNFDPSGRWDQNGSDAHWRNRPDNTPFFSVFNYGITHEGHANRNDPQDVETLDSLHEPEQAPVPPYHPDTSEMRDIWAHQYDLISVLDQRVNDILTQLKKDGLKEDTIVFFFSDHGFGQPRYKRWMYNTGIHVPLIVHVPDKFQRSLDVSSGERREELVSFIDFAPTVLNLCQTQIPGEMAGHTFLGLERDKPRKYVYGARSRADDIYDVSRAIRDERYIYIRNYMPHRAYIREAIIFSDRKRSFSELWRVKATSNLPEAGRKMFQPKPMQELYDLKKDPDELNNLAASVEQTKRIQDMHSALHDWILQSRDTGFLHEAEMMLRSRDSNPYEMAHDPSQFNLEKVLSSAETVGDTSLSLNILVSNLNDSDSGVRFWAAEAILARLSEAESLIPELQKSLNDESPSVRIVAAETLCHLGQTDDALKIVASDLQSPLHPSVVLQAASALREIGDKAGPLLPLVNKVRQENSGDVWGRYKSWMYPMFIGFALDQVVLNCGGELPYEVQA